MGHSNKENRLSLYQTHTHIYTQIHNSHKQTHHFDMHAFSIAQPQSHLSLLLFLSPACFLLSGYNRCPLGRVILSSRSARKALLSCTQSHFCDPHILIKDSHTHTHSTRNKEHHSSCNTFFNALSRRSLFPPLSLSLTHFHFLWIIHKLFYNYHNDSDLDSLVVTITLIIIVVYNNNHNNNNYKHNRRLLFVRPTSLEITNNPVRTSQNITKVLLQSQLSDKNIND